MGEDLSVTIDQYRSEVSSRIGQEMIHNTPVLQFLLDEGEDVFVPKAWTGINGIQPVKLEFIADAPTRLKPPSRKIPAAIFEASVDHKVLVVVHLRRFICFCLGPEKRFYMFHVEDPRFGSNHMRTRQIGIVDGSNNIWP